MAIFIDDPEWAKCPAVFLSKQDTKLCMEMAKHAAIGGRSQVRDNEDRQANLMTDQFVSMLGSYAAHRHFFGHIKDWMITRFYANLYPTKGDRGYDVPGCPLDFKTSLIRYPERCSSPKNYNLLVRPAERHTDNVYVLVLVEELDEKSCTTAYLIGWATDAELPDEVDQGGPFSGAYAFPARKLHRVMPMPWKWLP